MHHIIHHTDADGFGSAAVIAYFLMTERDVEEDSINFVGINYGMELNEKDFDYEDDCFYMVDFSLQPVEKMLEFCKKVGDQFVWIDHPNRDAFSLSRDRKPRKPLPLQFLSFSAGRAGSRPHHLCGRSFSPDIRS